MDFALKQTQLSDMKYQTKTLLSNWYEERCDPKSRNAITYNIPKNNDYNQAMLQKQKFNSCSDNWMNFQPKNQDMYISQAKLEFKNPKDQKRNSELRKFLTKPGFYNNSNKDELEKYIEKYFLCYKEIQNILQDMKEPILDVSKNDQFTSNLYYFFYNEKKYQNF